MLIRKRPVLCNYYVTYRCNASCSFCDIWEKPSPYITIENVKANLTDLKRLGVKVIDFTGGEPLLHRQLPDFLAEAKKLGFITTVTTNALLYPKYADKLKGKIDMLHFSLDSADREKHNISRGVACFDHVMKSIDIARALGERPDILFTVTSENIDELESIYSQITLPNKLMLILNPIFGYNDVGGDLDKSAIDKLRSFGRKKMVYLNQAFLSLRENGGNNINSPVCKAGTTSIVISPENKLIMPCYHLNAESYDINDQLYELRHSQEIKSNIAQEGKLDACAGCTINCYMQPSFAVNVNRYFFEALPSTLKYSLEKGTWKSLF